MPTDFSSSFERGRAGLRYPLLPLVHIVQWLYLAGPYARIADLLREFDEPVEMDHASYEHPGKLLSSHMDALCHLEGLKKKNAGQNYSIFAEDGTPVDGLEAIAQWTRHLILVRELEMINSLLCAPQGCTLCCTGPEKEQKQFFFEIPLQPEETALFELRQVDSELSRAASPFDENVFFADGRPFYADGPALYHWQKGWSMILPGSKYCPHLNEKGACRIYPRRPEVCRQPQIFPYLLERMPEKDAGGKKAFALRNKLLAVWDCPYVRELQQEIAVYAELCGLEPVFRENKS